ncbi:2-nitropropane dioxygenase [Mycena galopus ATCC 62051]|nr:2-nitropropane dioxygenase [Mycena galopus ATCC 62051]
MCLGVIGVLGYTPKILTRADLGIDSRGLTDKSLPFGVDLLIPQIGGSTRKTNYDYRKGTLMELIEVIIEEKTSPFVCAIGIPPKHAVEWLHQAGIPIMNMVGHPKHVQKALEAGMDLICAQAGEGGGHTGDIPTCVDAVKGHKPVYVVGAGAMYDGQGLAANLMWGAEAVWVGTRFVAAKEASVPQTHKDMIVSAGFEDAVTTLIYTGRPLRVRQMPYVDDWNNNRAAEIKELTGKGLLLHEVELEKHPEKSLETRPWLMGRVSSLINDVLPAKTIIDNMVRGAAIQLSRGNTYLNPKAEL